MKTRDYPLDSSIDICKLYNLPEPQAFLYLRSGAIEKVLEIYLNIFANELKQIKQDANKGIIYLFFYKKAIIKLINEFESSK